MIEEKVYKLVRFFCSFFMLFQVCIVVYVVFGRFILNNTPTWGEEISLLSMVWLSLFSAGLAIYDDTHIRISFVDNFFSKTGIRIRNVLFSILNIGFCVFLFIDGFNLVFLTRNSIMPGSKISVSLLYMSIPFAGLFYIFFQVMNFIREVKSWNKIQ